MVISVIFNVYVCTVHVWVCCIMGGLPPISIPVVLCVSVYVCVCVIVWSDVLRMTPKHRKCKQGCVAHGCEGRTHIVHMFVETHSDTYFEDAEAES